MTADRIDSDEFRALVGEELWGYAPRGEVDDVTGIDDDVDMGKTTILIVVVATCACATPPRMEPFTPARRTAGAEGMRHAFQAMIDRGLEPRIDPGAGAAYGAAAPIVTDWRRWHMQTVRWAVYLANDEVIVDSVCTERVAAEKSGPSTAAPAVVVRRCVQQEPGLSAIAAEIVGAIPRDLAGPPERVEHCFSVNNGPPTCFGSQEECEQKRSEGPTLGVSRCSPR